MDMAKMNLIGDLIDANDKLELYINVNAWDEHPLTINGWKLTQEEAQIMVEMSELVSTNLLDQQKVIDKICRTSNAA